MNHHNILDDERTSDRFEVYDQFHNQKDAKPLIELLKANNIPYEVEVPKQLMDTVLGGEAHAALKHHNPQPSFLPSLKFASPIFHSAQSNREF